MIIFLLISNLVSYFVLSFFPYQAMPASINIAFRGMIYFAIGILLIYLFYHFVDKKNFLTLGLSIKNHCLDFFNGGVIALVALLIGTTVLYSFHQIHIEVVSLRPLFLLSSLISIFLIALLEEVYFRGYLINILLQRHDRLISLIISSIIFASLHIFNNNSSITSIINTFFAGLILGLLYIKTNNLWYAVGFHFIWNLIQSFLGFNVSGINMPSLFKMSYVSKNIINGGNYGFEGSIICTLILITINIFLLTNYKKQYQQVY